MSDGSFPRPPRAYPPHAQDGSDRQIPSTDPLLELARLIGQSDPFGPPPARSGDSPRGYPDLPTRGPMARPPSREIAPPPPPPADRYEGERERREPQARAHPFPSLQTFPSRAAPDDHGDDRYSEPVDVPPAARERWEPQARAHPFPSHQTFPNRPVPDDHGDDRYSEPVHRIRRGSAGSRRRGPTRSPRTRPFRIALCPMITAMTAIPSRSHRMPRRRRPRGSNFLPLAAWGPIGLKIAILTTRMKTIPRSPIRIIRRNRSRPMRNRIITRISAMRGRNRRARRLPPTRRKRRSTRANMSMPKAIGTANMNMPTVKRASMRTNPVAGGATRSRSRSRLLWEP